MTARNVGAGELLRFLLEKAPDKEASAVVGALLAFVDTRSGPNQYKAWPSYALIAALAHVSRTTAIDRLDDLYPWVQTLPQPRSGQRQAPNVYDLSRAAEEILRARRPKLRAVGGSESTA